MNDLIISRKKGPDWKRAGSSSDGFPSPSESPKSKYSPNGKTTDILRFSLRGAISGSSLIKLE